MKRTILYLAFALCTTISIRTEASPGRVAPAADSLRHALTLTEGIEKLRTYEYLANTYKDVLNQEWYADSLFSVLDQMQAEARRQGNNSYQAQAEVRRISALSNLQRYDQLIADAPAALSRIAELKAWRHYYDVYTSLCNVYTRKGNNQKALEVAQQMHEDARGHQNPAGMGLAFLAMSRVYNSQRQFDKQEESLRQASTLLQDSTRYINNLATVYINLGWCLIAQQRYEEALQVAIDSEDVNRRYEQASHSKQNSAWINTYALYLDTYRQWEKFELAEVYLNKVDSLTNGKWPMYTERAHILYGRGKYAEALEVINRRLTENPLYSLNAVDLKMMILAAMTNNQEGYQLHRSIVARMDSINKSTFTAQLDEIRTQYEVDRHIAEKTRNRNYYLLASAGCLLLIILLAAAVYHNRTINHKNRILYQQIKGGGNVPRRGFHADNNGGDDDGGDAPHRGFHADGNEELVHRLRQYLLTDGNLTREDINRDDIITALGTNRNILGEAVKAVTGKTLMEYIRSLQLEEARHQIDNHPELTIEVIAMNCGLNANTFYRLFKKHYGMSPAEYRKLGQQA